MYLKFKHGKQNEIICKAIDKAGSERKMCKVIGIPKGSLYRYKFELNNMPEDRILRLLNFLNLDIGGLKDYFEYLPSNWGKSKGGRNCVKKKRIKGTFDKDMKKLKAISSKRMKDWHKYMKDNFPEEYHIKQYNKFKKIDGGYACKLSNGVCVRNKLEKIVGDFLISCGFDFEYEPYFNISGKAYFPDFKVNNIMIEVTEWKNPDKNRIIKLKNKIKDYKESGFRTIFFIPVKVRKFYKEIEDFIISDLEKLKMSLMLR